MRNLAILLLVGLATLGRAVDASGSPPPEGAASPGGAAAEAVSSREFEGVWYRTPEKRGGFVVWLATGDLTVDAETISFKSKKIPLTIAVASVKRVTKASLPGDPANTWIVVEYEEGGATKAAAFRGSGLTARDNQAILTAFLSSMRAAAFARGESPAPREKAAIDFDGRSWKQGFHQNAGSQSITEYVLPNETVNGWTELVSVQTFPGAQETKTLAAIAAGFRDKLQKECPSALWKVLKESPDELMYEFRTAGCRGWDDQHEIAKLMKGKSGIFRVSYTSHKLPLDDQLRARWVALVGAGRIEAMAGPEPAAPKAIAGGAPADADVGKSEAPAEFAPYEGLKEQFTIAIPVGWRAHDQDADRGQAGPYGVVIFSPLDLGSTKVAADYQKQLEVALRTMEGIDSGETTSFLLDRYKAERGTSCDGIEDKARKRLVDRYESFTIGRSSHLLGAPEVEAVDVGGCHGLRVRLRARDAQGTETDALVYAVSDGKVMYDFFLRNQKEYFEENLPVFEKSMATLRIAAGR